MSRNGSNIYSKPAGTTAISGTDIESAKFNELMDDIAGDLNLARPVVAGGTGASTPAAARVNLGVTIGTDVQGYDAGLASIAGLTTAADKAIYTTGADTYATFDIGALSRTFLANTTEAGMRSTLALGTAATRAAEDTLSNGSNLPDGAAVKAYADGSLSAGTNGSVTLPNGLIMKWGKVTGAGAGETTVTFPTSFPTAIYNVQVTVTGNLGAGSLNYSYARSASTTSVIVGRDPDAFWTAIGK